MDNNSLRTTEEQTELREKRITFGMGVIVAVVALIAVVLIYREFSAPAVKKSPSATSSIYSSMSLEQAEIVDGDLLLTFDGNHTELWYVHHVIRDGGYQDRVILEYPGRPHSPISDITHWLRIRDRVKFVYHKGTPDYFEKAARYINQPH